MASRIFPRGALRACRSISTCRRTASRLSHLLAAALLMGWIGAGVAQAGTLDTWDGGSGSWTDPHWSILTPPGYPSNVGATTYNASIPLAGSDVILGTTVFIDNLTVGAGATLEVITDGDPVIKMYAGAGTITNSGTIKLTTTGMGSPSITFDGTGSGTTTPMGTLGGGGTVILSGGGIGVDGGDESITTDNKIMGSGSISALNLINHGIINANVSTGVLTVEAGSLGSVKNVATGVAGSGSLMATGGGTLALLPGTFDNTDPIPAHAGTISATGGSEVVLGSFSFGTTLIKGGTLSTDTDFESTFVNIKIATLNGVTLFTPVFTPPPPFTYATYTQADGTTTNLEGAITNDGVIEVSSLGVGGPSLLILDSGDVTLSGMGSIRLKGTSTGIPPDPNFVKIQGKPTARLTIGSFQTITGNAQFGSHGRSVSPKLTNHGTITAMISSMAPPGSPPEGITFFPLILDPVTMLPVPDALINDGMLQANENSFLTFSNGTVSNSSAVKGGLIIAKGTTMPGIVSPGMVILQEGATVNGGTILLDGFMSQLQLNSGTARPATLTNTSGGMIFTIAPSTANTLGGTITNSGPGSSIFVKDNSSLTMDNASLSGGSVTNSSLIQIGTGMIPVGPAALTINSGSLTNFDSMTGIPGMISVAANGMLNLVGTGGVNSTINGGIVSITAGPGTIKLNNGTIHAGTLNNVVGGFVATVVGSMSNRLGGIVNNPAGATIEVDSNSTLDLETGGTYNNAGTIFLNGGPPGVAILQPNGSGAGGNVSLSGLGSVILMGDGASNQILGAGGNERLINVDNTISGGGFIGGGKMSLTNKVMGSIRSTLGAGLTIQPVATGSVINGGVIQTFGANLTLMGGTFTNIDDGNLGTIQAVAGGAATLFAFGAGPANNAVIDNGRVNVFGTMELSNVTIHHGTLTNFPGGTIRTANAVTTNTLGGMVNNFPGATINDRGGSTIFLETTGVYTNSGIIYLTGSNLRPTGADGTVTLGGAGTVNIDAASSIFGDTGSETLLNTNNTIRGGGTIGTGKLALINRALIDVTAGAGMTIQPNNAGLTNSGTIQANGQPLTLLNGTFTNFEGATNGLIQAVGNDVVNVTGVDADNNSIVNGGNVTIVAGGTINLSFGTIHNGTLTNSATGTINSLANTTNTLGGTVNNTAGGVIAVAANSTLMLETGGTYNNPGVLTINEGAAGAPSKLQLNGDGGTVTLSGGGTVRLVAGGGGGNSISGVVGNERLINLDNAINGTGLIGLNTMSLTNDGTIDAGVFPGITISPNSGGVINGGILQASGIAVLTLNGGIYTNTIGVIQAKGVGLGSEVDLQNGVTINGGNLKNDPGDLIRVVDEAVLNTLTNKGNIAQNEGSILDLIGTITNKGTITMAATNFVTQIKLLSGDVTLDGSGSLMMLRSGLNQIIAANGLDRLTIGAGQTVRGTGDIGVGAMALTNNGKIIADQPAPLTIHPNLFGFLNTSTLQAAAGSTLDVIGGYTQTSGDTNVLGTLSVTGGPLVAGGGTLSGSGPSTISGGFSLTGTFTKLDSGAATISGPQSFSSGATLHIDGGTVRFSVGSGSVTVGTGVTATVASGATLELAGTGSALSSGTHRVNVSNGSTASGIVVSGTSQQVGNIDGSGNTTISTGGDLTANHIIQSALIIGGTTSSSATVTIAASDASGSPLLLPGGDSAGFVVASTLTPDEPFASGSLFSTSLTSEFYASPVVNTQARYTEFAPSNLGNFAVTVPEPSALLLAVLGLAAALFAARSRGPGRRSRRVRGCHAHASVDQS